MTAVELIAGWISILGDGSQLAPLASASAVGFVSGVYSGAMLAMALATAVLGLLRRQQPPLLWFAGTALLAAVWNALAQYQLHTESEGALLPLVVAGFVALLLRHGQVVLRTAAESADLHRRIRGLFFASGLVGVIGLFHTAIGTLLGAGLLVAACALLIQGSLRRMRHRGDVYAAVPLLGGCLVLTATLPHAALNVGLPLPLTPAFWANALQLALGLAVLTLGIGALSRNTGRGAQARDGSTLDPVTQLPDRPAFVSALNQRLQSASEDQQLAIVSIGMPQLRTLEHDVDPPTAEAGVAELAQRLRQASQPTELLSRVHPERFAWVASMPPPASLVELQSRCTSLRHQLTAPLALAEGAEINCNFGIAVFPEHGRDADALLRRSDEALYRAEKAGPGELRIFNLKVQEQAHQQAVLAKHLREALSRNELELHYQPLLDLQTGELRGLEALVRWRRDGRMIPPNEFIPLAEASDLIIDLGEWVMRRACQQAADWQASGIRIPSIAVNVSPNQFRHNEFTSQVVGAMQDAGRCDTRLALEITENVVLDDIDGTRKLLQQLSERGVDAAVDDFGVGYSSLSYLRKLPVKAVKIDRSFLSGIPDEPEAVSIIGTIISLGRDLGLQVIAEGIETEEQHSFLSNRGVRYGQGFLLSKPLPPIDLERWISARAWTPVPA